MFIKYRKCKFENIKLKCLQKNNAWEVNMQNFKLCLGGTSKHAFILNNAWEVNMQKF